jgi:hypothetical protein
VDLSYKYGHLNFIEITTQMSLLTRFHRFTFAKIYKNFVNGDFVDSKDAQRYPVRNPVTQEVLGYCPQTSQ